MAGFLVAYAVISGLVAKNVATSLQGHRLVASWFDAFKAAFVVAFLLLLIGDATVW